MLEIVTFCERGHLKTSENIIGKNQCKECNHVAQRRLEKTPKYKTYRKEYQKKEVSKEYKRKYYQENKDKFFASHLKRRYGITIEQYQAMFEKQKGLCAICGVVGSETPKGLVVDHNHKTKEIRGLLCNTCNSHVVDVLERFQHLIVPATEYLKRGKYNA